ncbi:hypothetical protein IEQ34_021545 [Dendrobium chrysotoxum]|uniref:Uncharacterized protein n=1 Tax=Dendrobium chrysotoxum TaxID=161865 RepID=A0AAV7G545_DENCH|nr:hypothetical protein IEQ34_021545 [Dendrobium chrysotoxum]
MKGMTSVPQQNKMTVELLLSLIIKEELPKQLAFYAPKLASCDKQDFKIAETEISDALNAVDGLLTISIICRIYGPQQSYRNFFSHLGCAGPDPDLLLIHGPVRCHIGFPAWTICYIETVRTYGTAKIYKIWCHSQSFL